MKSVAIIGGGITGTTCAEYISALSHDIKITLITATDVVKTAITTRKVTARIDELNVNEGRFDAFERQFKNLKVVIGLVNSIDANEKLIKLDTQEIHYDTLCICTGAKPKVLASNHNPHVIYIRDTDTVKHLRNRLENSKKLIVIGNGGIAMEHEVEYCHITWCVKSDHIGNVFFNEGSAAFFMDSFLNRRTEKDIQNKKSEQTIFTRRVYDIEREFVRGDSESSSVGSALGPSWSKYQKLSGSLNNDTQDIFVKYNCEPKKIFSNENGCSEENVYVELTNGKILGADLVICATGAIPNVPFDVKGGNLSLSTDGGIIVDSNMRTNISNIYAAGDVCSANWEHAKHWTQMKLWTQGWQMGAFAGKCIVENTINKQDLPLDFCFELFTHATTFFGYKVCLLGCFNAEKIDGENCEYIIRHTPNEEYIELVVKDGCIHGATLIGETDLEETFENLIINQINIGFLGESILDPNVDIEDYFD